MSWIYSSVTDEGMWITSRFMWGAVGYDKRAVLQPLYTADSIYAIFVALSKSHVALTGFELPSCCQQSIAYQSAAVIATTHRKTIPALGTRDSVLHPCRIGAVVRSCNRLPETRLTAAKARAASSGCSQLVLLSEHASL